MRLSEDFYCYGSPHSASSSSSKFPFKCFYEFMAPVASAPGSQVSVVTFRILLSFQILG